MVLKVFLAEDSPAQCAYLTHILQTEAGVEVIGIAETEKQAIDWLDRHAGQWDVALVDLFLGEGTGAGVIQHCHDRRPDQSVLVMTNHTRDDALMRRCKLLGADAVYQKSTELDSLVAYFTGLAAQKPLRAAQAPAA